MEGPEVEKDSSVDGDGDAESETTTSTTAVKTEKYSSKNETKKPKHKPAAEPKQKREDSSRRRSGGGAAAAAAAAGSTHEEMQLSKVNQASTTRCLCRVFTYPVFSIFLFKKKKLPAVNTRAQREGNMSCRRCVHTQMQPALYLHSRSPLFSRPILCFSSPPLPYLYRQSKYFSSNAKPHTPNRLSGISSPSASFPFYPSFRPSLIYLQHRLTLRL